MSPLPGTVMPATWRRLPVTAPEYEWLLVNELPRKVWHFHVLIQHRKTHDTICATVLCPAGGAIGMYLKNVYTVLPQAISAPSCGTTLHALLETYYFPRLFTRYGFDRAAFGAALRSELPLELHHKSQQLMRVFLHQKSQKLSTQLARARAQKKPRVYRELAKALGRTLYKIGAAIDTWLWSK